MIDGKKMGEGLRELANTQLAKGADATNDYMRGYYTGCAHALMSVVEGLVPGPSEDYGADAEILDFPT